MKFQHRDLLGLTTSLALFFGVLAIGARLVAQETASGQTSSAVSSDLMTDDHDRGPRNGPLAVATVTIIDGGYGTFQLATLPNDGGPYHFLTTVDHDTERSLPTVTSLRMAGKSSSGLWARQT